MSRDLSTQNHLVPLFQEFLADGKAATSLDLVQEAYRFCRERDLYFWVADFPERVARMVKRGQLVAVLASGKNYYFLPKCLPEDFDLTDPHSRLVASDWCEEHGQLELANLLRKCKSVKGQMKPVKGLYPA